MTLAKSGVQGICNLFKNRIRLAPEGSKNEISDFLQYHQNNTVANLSGLWKYIRKILEGL
jgi:hypothetical protein